MNPPTQTKTIEMTLKAAPALVYRAWTNSSALREWLCDVATTAPRAGGHLFLSWHSGFSANGVFTHLEAEKHVAFTWHGRLDPATTEVVITLEPAGTGTHMTLVHRGLEQFPDPADTAARFEQEWRVSLPNLEAVLDQGPDLRITQRPMLGVLISDFSAEVAQKLGVPVTEGVRLGGVVDGMGAQAAGLQKDDVIVSVNAIPTAEFGKLGQALAGHKAGDVMEVIFYRGAEKKTAQMKLSGRRIPPIPATPAELAEHLRTVYGEAAASLDKLLAGVTDDEAARQPAPGEWSARETIAHLIHSERGWQNNLYEIVGGEEAQYDGFFDNLPMRIQATVAAYPALSDLVEELRRLFAETCEMIACLPESFLARKGSYWRLGFNALNFSTHVEEHLTQIQAALEK